jgi:four helix bundle protein
MRKEIEEKLIALSVGVNTFILNLPKSTLNLNLGEQIARSSTSAALNYGEAQGAESKKDFIHKTSVVLKELRETSIGLRIFSQAGITSTKVDLDDLIDKCGQLTAIFQKTVSTARKNAS